jgi:hypothetical protein
LTGKVFGALAILEGRHWEDSPADLSDLVLELLCDLGLGSCGVPLEVRCNTYCVVKNCRCAGNGISSVVAKDIDVLVLRQEVAGTLEALGADEGNSRKSILRVIHGCLRRGDFRVADGRLGCLDLVVVDDLLGCPTCLQLTGIPDAMIDLVDMFGLKVLVSFVLIGKT